MKLRARAILLAAVAIVLASSVPASAQPSILISPERGHPGTIVSIWGSGFSPNTRVTIYFDETIIATTYTYSDGSLYTSVQIPLTASPGYHAIKARDAVGYEASARFEVTEPKFALNPSSGPVGTLVEVRASGLAPGHEYAVLFDSIQLYIINVLKGRSYGFIVEPDDNGDLWFTVSVPAATGGVHNITLDYWPARERWYQWLYGFKPVVFNIPFNVTVGVALSTDVSNMLARVSDLELKVRSVEVNLSSILVELPRLKTAISFLNESLS
ncbi:MAG: hypothetical protein ACP5KA_07495, partial [Desulfurococcaceae archaeon]